MRLRLKHGQTNSVTTEPKTGEVWWAEIDFVAKSRPVLVLYYPAQDDARSMAILAPLTSQVRIARGEVQLGKISWLPKPSAVNVQGLGSFDKKCLIRRMGILPADILTEVKQSLRDLLGL